MAASEDQRNMSCVLDPNFAVVCSFFEKFSSLCGIKQHTHKELQEMIDFVDEIPPELIDLHIRLMRKARKNVNPERWQRTLAKFCYFSLPDDCWALEQKGYKELNHSQRLRILVALIGSQFDYNVRFKTDINKLGIDDLRLSPFGRDKTGNNYWLHADEDLGLKIYKEDLETEKWELVAKNREELVKLIDMLMKERDPNRKLDEIEEEEEEEPEEEEEKEEEKEPEKPNASDEKPESEREQQPQVESEPKKEPSPLPEPATQAEIAAPVQIKSDKNHVPLVESSQQHAESIQPSQKSLEPVAQEPPSQNEKKDVKPVPKFFKSKPRQPTDSQLPVKKPFELKKKKFADPPPKPLDKESFAQHIKTLHSHEVMRPLLYDNDIAVGNDAGDSLKSKINQKFNAIKPTMSNARDLLIVKTAKPGLKLEQILKSKLAQKLAANSPVTSETKETSAADAPAASPALPSQDATSIESPSVNPESIVEAVSVTPATDAASLKRKLSNEDGSSEAKKSKPSEADDEDGVIEEPVMLITGVGSGKACDTGNETDSGKKTESTPPSNIPTNQLTHKVDDILKKGESENGESASTSDETSRLPAAKCEADLAGEKKKPKLWTIDAICSSDTKETKRSDDISSFPNYSFNRDIKKSENSLLRSSGSGESYSIFNLAADSKEDHSMSMPTNFYFGCNNQNPCFLPSERSPMNNYKPPNKTHNVKDFVDNLEAKESCHLGASEVPKFNVESLCSKAPSIANDATVKECVDKESGCASSNKTEKVLNLSSEFSAVDNSKVALSLSTSNVSGGVELAPLENICQANETNADDEMSSETAVESSHTETKTTEVTHSETTHDTSPTNVSETANPPHSTVDIPEPVINIDAATSKSADEALPLAKSVSVAVANQKVEPLLESEDSNIESKLEETTVGELSKTSLTDVGSCVSDKPVAVEPLTEAVNVETNEKTDIDDSRKFDAVKSPHPVPRGDDKPTPIKVFDEPVHKSEKPSSSTLMTEVDETKPANDAVTDQVTSAPSASPSVSPLLRDSNSESVAKQNCEPTVDKPLISNESHRKPVEEDSVQSSSQISAIEPVELRENSSTAVLLIESKLQPKAANITELQFVDEKLLPTQKTTAAEPVDCVKPSVEPTIEPSSGGVEAQVESKDPPPSEDTGEQLNVPTDTNVELLVGQSSQPSSLNRTKPTDDAVISSASGAPVKARSEEAAEGGRGVTELSISDGICRDKRQGDEISATPKGDPEPDRRAGEGIKSDVEKPKKVGLDNVDEADSEKTESFSESRSSTGTVEPAAEAKGSESDAPTKLDQPGESTCDDKSAVSAAEETKKEDAAESKLTSSSSEESTRAVEEKSTDADIGQTESKRTESSETKVETTASQPTASDESKDTVTPQLTSGRRKTRRTEASRLLEENGSVNEEPVESAAPKRATRRSQVGADVEEDPVKGKSAKGGKSKSVTPAVEGKRRGRQSQLAVSEKSAVKEPAGKKGKGKAALEEGKRAESSKKGEKETPSTKGPAALKKRGGRGKKLSKEIVDDSDDDPGDDSEAKSNDDDTETQNEDSLDGHDKNEGSVKKSEKPAVKKRVTKRGWINEVDIKNIEKPNKDGSPGIRQSRRIAQLKIKEQAEVKYVEPVTTPKKTPANQKSKPVSSVKKNITKSPNKKNKNKSARDESEDEVPEKIGLSSKKKKKKTEPKKNFDVTKAWKASSDSSSEEEEAEEDDHFDEDEEEIVINDASDHEFSPESDIDDDDDYKPVKRARTAHSKPSAEDEIERDDLNCQSCGTADDPEWILLCDACDEGWHASCLKPPMLSIPEGDWFCPLCQHNKLITNLQKFLITFDKNVKKKANEELRKKRLEYVDISFSNIIIDSQATHKVVAKATRTESESSGSTDGSSSEESEEEEPLYQLRVRRQVNVSHRLNEYEELMNSAIQREDNIQMLDTGPVPEPEVNETPVLPNGDEHAPPEQEVAQPDDDNDENEAEDDNEEEPEEDLAEDKKVAPVILNLRNIRKRPVPLTKLDVSSEDDRYSDEDFKGSSADDRDEDDDYGKSETDSDEAEYRSGRHGPVRRSTRARVARYDKDFINDNSDDDDDEEYGSKKKKKKRKRYSESESEEDETWGSRKKKKAARPTKSSRSSHKKRKRIRFDGDSDEERKKTVKSRIKYGLDESEDDHPQRRTRGKKINYVENLGSDSEEEDFSQKKKAKKIVSDDDEYVEDNGNDQDANPESKSNSEEDDESKSDADSTPGNDPTADPDEPPPTADSTKAVSPTQPAAEPKAVVDETSAPKLNEVASPKKNDKTEVHEKIPVAEEAATKPSMPIEGAKIMNQTTPVPMQQSYGDIIQEDPKMAPTIVDANSSLKGMHSMAQSLGQLTAAAAAAVYPAAAVVDPKYPPVSTAAGPVSVNYAEVGIRYEDGDGEKFAPPLRVISPSKLYAMQEQKRPPLPPQFATPPHIPPPGMPPSRMMIPHSMPNAMRMPNPVPMGSAPQMRPPLPNVLQPPQPGMGLPSAVPVAKPKPARKSRSKKQQEQERLEREAMEAAGRSGEEVMPMHMLKGPAPPPSELNMPRPPHPPMPPFTNASAPPFMSYPNVPPPMRFPPQPMAQSPSTAPPVSAPAPVSTSKRVKHTPTRMSMAAPQNMMRFQRPPGTAPLYRPPQPVDTPTSGANQAPHNDKGPMLPPCSGAPAVTTAAGKSEPTSVAPPIMKPEQYYLPMSTYPPSQMPRGQHRAEFTFVRNPMPPSGYRQPGPGAPALTVTSSYGRPPYPYSVPVPGAAAPPHAPPPVNHSSPSKLDAGAAKAPPSTVPTSTPPTSYPSPYLPPPAGAPTTSPKMAHPPPVSTAPYQMLHMKQLPLTVAATMQSSTAPNLIYPPPSMYYSSPMMAAQYGHPAQPPLAAPQPYPSVTQAPPTSGAGGARPLPPTSMPYQPAADLPPGRMPPEYAVPTSQPANFHYAPEPAPMPAQPAVSAPSATAPGDSATYGHQQASAYDKEADEERQQAAEQPQTPTEESSGEFGGLVSYFSSQREDDLDS